MGRWKGSREEEVTRSSVGASKEASPHELEIAGLTSPRLFGSYAVSRSTSLGLHIFTVLLELDMSLQLQLMICLIYGLYIEINH